MKIWIEFDKDKSGYIESNELKQFILKLLESNKNKNFELTDERLDEYTQSIVY